MNNIIKKLVKDPFQVIQELTIPEMENLINHLRDSFFNNESVVSDDIYDLLIDYLMYKDPKNKLIKVVGAEVKSKNKVELDYYLGSMDKVKPDSNKLEKWIKKYKSPYVLTDKLDGVSALLVYKKNGDIKLFTRGTATHGIDITSILKYLSLPKFVEVEKYVKNKKIKSKNIDNLISFRGELIISKVEFDNNWSSKKSNARNTVSGLVNSKHIDPDLAKSTSLVIYEIVDPIFKLSRQLEICKEIGFKTVHNKEIEEISYDILSKYLVKRKEKSKFIIDGIIVSNDDLHKRNSTGNPEYAFAFKDVLEDQKANTEIIDIEWNVSKDGYINPTVIIKPVVIGGVTINRVTAYNAKYVVDNKIGKGAKIEIIRSGDVIPKIQKVLKPVSKVKLPDGDWEWNETKVDIISKNLKSKEIIIRNTHYFLSSLDVKGLGLKVVEKLYDNGFKSIQDILKAKKEDFLKNDFKEKTSQNIFESVKKSLNNNLNLHDLMSASNQLGHGMGSERCKLILDKYPNLLTEYKNWSKKEFIEKIRAIPGFEEKTSQLFVDNFPKFIDFYNSIKDYITLKKQNESKKKKSSLNGKIIVISGFRDKDLENLLKQYDVDIKNSVSKNTNILVVKDKETIEDSTGKVKKAKDLGIKIITKKELLSLTN